MKKICLFVLAALLLLALPLPASADEPAKYNFASAQGDKNLKVTPGGEVKGDIYFYNIDGNRITHITLEVGQAPSGWEITIEPPLSETQVMVNSILVTVTENLYVEPGELLSEEPQTVPEGMISITVPGRGYTLGKLAQVMVSVPESAALGTTGEITIAAEATWLGQTGAAAVKQARDFDFTVTVVSESAEFTEVIIDENGVEDETVSTNGVAQAAAPRWWPALVGGAAAAVIVGVAVSRRRAAKRRALR
ncbi:MAG: hypothetical protein JW790_05540 [Dehalococcoidales bacterium]|nr:hypothetical protein [Dehalococcoidales bacterium]